MADQQPVLDVADNTSEKVALDLLHMIAHIERRALHSKPPTGWTSASRTWLLDTYAECLRAVRSPEDRDTVAPRAYQDTIVEIETLKVANKGLREVLKAYFAHDWSGRLEVWENIARSELDLMRSDTSDGSDTSNEQSTM
jgi:hypothetical protein